MLLHPEHSQLVITLVYHYDELVGYVKRRFGDHHFAQDVVHDVCLELMERPPLSKVHTPMAFLRKLSRNRAIDRYRQYQTQQAHLTILQQTAVHSHQMDGERVLHFVQRLEALKQIIEALPSRQRQVFLLHKLHEMPQQEIADELGISRNMVTQHFSKAMTAINLSWGSTA
ncbi:RNA polymerase sigma factor [Methylophilus aquaticus]|uniref:RNA polymerase sigma factor n=1 Tax=Methylophilus aquaticus TaxID=1971610 RepID=A0ABT9JUV9_9PROT|nr:RNA polymerase sigma factor [Methylophilus aquaticus]MDP8568342.1 RNA polymerase sigma factor [Methylophilus aquaticus]